MLMSIEMLNEWNPVPVHTERLVDRWASDAFAALIGRPAPRPGSATLPPLWHWFTLLDTPQRHQVGADGHRASGPLVPPLPPGTRRMFAGGRWRLISPIAYGDRLHCQTTVDRMQMKQGKSGALLFVTLKHELSVDGRGCAVEEQDLVYRLQEDEAPAAAPARAGATTPARTKPEDTFHADLRLSLPTDESLLARFSALTYNGHRIHYDHPYTTQVEGYPSLVIHGPLLALTALESLRTEQTERVIDSLSYRLARPMFLPSTIEAGAQLGDDGRVRFRAGADLMHPSLTGECQLRS